jgi:hypothetical protein
MWSAICPHEICAHEHAEVVQHAGNGRRTAAPRTQHHNDRLGGPHNTSNNPECRERYPTLGDPASIAHSITAVCGAGRRGAVMLFSIAMVLVVKTGVG